MTAERYGQAEFIQLPLEGIRGIPHLQEAVLEALALGQKEIADRTGECMTPSM